jgi:hypothetical protein
MLPPVQGKDRRWSGAAATGLGQLSHQLHVELVKPPAMEEDAADLRLLRILDCFPSTGSSSRGGHGAGWKAGGGGVDAAAREGRRGVFGGAGKGEKCGGVGGDAIHESGRRRVKEPIEAGPQEAASQELG